MVLSDHGSQGLGIVISLSPSLDKFAHTLNALTTEAFCEKISPLFLSIDLHNLDGSITNMRPNEVPLDLKVLSAVYDTLFGCKEQGAPLLSSKLGISQWIGKCNLMSAMISINIE
jgi:hypothetical protein